MELNTKLNQALEAESDVARNDAERIRGNVLYAVLACFALAIAAAAGVGYYLLRSISRPVAALRAAAVRVGAGYLDARVVEVERVIRVRVGQRRRRSITPIVRRFAPRDKGSQCDGMGDS